MPIWDAAQGYWRKCCSVDEETTSVCCTSSYVHWETVSVPGLVPESTQLEMAGFLFPTAETYQSIWTRLPSL